MRVFKATKIFRNGGSLFYFLQPFGAVGVVDRDDGLWVGIFFFLAVECRGMGFLGL